MAYGTIKVDTITFTDGAGDKSVTISGLVQNPTFTGNVTVTGTVSGTTATFTTGTFTSLTGATSQGTTATYTSGSFTSLTGVTTSGTTANFVSGVFTTQISGATITGTAGAFATLTGGVATLTSGVFALGTEALPSITFTGDTDTGIYSPGENQVAISTDGSGRLFVDASGNVGVGTASPAFPLQIGATGAGGIAIDATNSAIHGTFGSGGNVTLRAQAAASSGGGDIFLGGSTRGDANVDSIVFSTANTVRAKIDSSGYFTVSSNIINGFEFNDSSAAIYHSFGSGGGLALRAQTTATAGGGEIFLGGSSRGDGNVNAIVFSNANTERVRIDSSGRLLVGTSSSKTVGAGQYSLLNVQGYVGASNGGGDVTLSRGETAANITTGEVLGFISFTDSAGYAFGQFYCEADGTAGTNDYPGRLVFTTTADGASSPTERMRITNDGNVTIGSDGNTTLFNQTSITGVVIERAGAIQLARSGDQSLLINRIANDGTLVGFYQDGTQEGTISVSGSTVSYNGAHLSRWSQLPSGQERTEILRGTVLSNIDEMCEWGEENNEQLNRMKVSDVEGDKNVSGVFQAWDDDDDTYTNDFYCAMTGDFIIRIAAGVTVERGDLLMSAGDGTAKPQDDDIIRSKTIAKVTSTNVSCTYEDGSYCVPCVLMAC